MSLASIDARITFISFYDSTITIHYASSKIDKDEKNNYDHLSLPAEELELKASIGLPESYVNRCRDHTTIMFANLSSDSVS